METPTTVTTLSLPPNTSPSPPVTVRLISEPPLTCSGPPRSTFITWAFPGVGAPACPQAPISLGRLVRRRAADGPLRCRPPLAMPGEPGSGGARFSADRLFHERGDPCLVGGGQLRQREGDRPHGAVVQVRHVVEAERRVPGLELLRGLEEADDLAVLGVRGHPVPGSRREGWRTGGDEGMQPLGQGAI